MSDETQRLFEGACAEIRALRRRLELAEARLQVLDLVALVFHTRPAYPSQGMAEDVVWKIEQELARRLTEKPAKAVS